MNKLIFSLIIVSVMFPLMSLFGGEIAGFDFGVNVYYTLLIAYLIASINKLFKLKAPPKEIRSILNFLFLFTAYCVISSVLFPFIFEGVRVFSPRIGIDSQVNLQTPLKFSFSNIGQSIYIVLNFLFVFISVHCIDEKYFTNKIGKYLRVLSYLLLGFTFWQIISKWFGLYFPYEVVFNTLDRGEINQTTSGFYRINGTMREPSDLGRLLSTIFVYILLSGIKKKYYTDIILSFIFIPLIFISTSSTGIFVIAIVLAFFGAVIFKKILFSLRIERTSFLVFVAIIIVFILVYSVYYEQINTIVQITAINKLETQSFNSRSSADIYSFEVLRDTYYLGAGLGSNRPSSFFTQILSNLGIIGMSLFIALNFKLYMLYKKYENKDSDLTIFFSAYATCLLAKLIAGPDMSTEYYWLFFALLVIKLTHVITNNKTIIYKT